MAKGIRVPIDTDRNGRLSLLGGDDYIEQLIFTGLGEGDSENPFQDIGLGEGMIFGINDSLSDGQIREGIARVFAHLEADQLARLDHAASAITFEEYRGELGVERRCNVSYINMETQERREIEVPIAASSES